MARQKLFYGWIIVATAILGIASSFSVLVLNMTGLFAAPLKAEFGWSTSQIFLGSGIAGIGGILSAPFIGAISDRFGVRRVLALSFAIEALILLSYKFMGSDPMGYYVRYGALAVLCMGTTQVVFSRIISAWFNRRLGLALGLALAGVGVGGAIWSLVIQKFIDLYGWRNAYAGMAALIACITLPLVVLLVRETPLAMGQNIDGDENSTARATTAAVEHSGLTLREAAGTGQYWLMIGVFLLMGCGLQSVQIHLVPLLVSRGNSAQLASQVQATLSVAVIFGRVFSGWLLDRLFAPRVAQLFLIAPIIGISALILGVTGAPAFAAAMCVGLAVGGESDVVAYLVRRYFGLRQYSRIYGTFFSAYGTASAIGPYATAWGLDHLQGGYSRLLWVHVALLVAAFVLLFGYRRYSVEK
ncbi:MAG: MFS transporter [Steroidobacteraceae bacterium]